MTKIELASAKETINLLAQAWNNFIFYTDNNKDNINDFRKCINDAQRILFTKILKSLDPSWFDGKNFGEYKTLLNNGLEFFDENGKGKPGTSWEGWILACKVESKGETPAKPKNFSNKPGLKRLSKMTVEDFRVIFPVIDTWPAWEIGSQIVKFINYKTWVEFVLATDRSIELGESQSIATAKALGYDTDFQIKP